MLNKTHSLISNKVNYFNSFNDVGDFYCSIVIWDFYISSLSSSKGSIWQRFSENNNSFYKLLKFKIFL